MDLKGKTFLSYFLLAVMAFVSSAVLPQNPEEIFKTEFKEIKETAFGLEGKFTVTNITDKDIDDVQLWIHLHDASAPADSNKSLTSTAYTDATPGLVWLKAGKSTILDVPLRDPERHKQARELLETNPGAAKFVLQIERIVFVE